ncbi:C45 family autoproteolytic acyltransferase/hydolase [Virgibacillus salexigens]|uniref:C45 family autoproteolytic acyltransferase/hydolase n=1 Tax=Virgibacillus TaxID=84406 RepID=UPI0013702082|nr:MULTISPECIES: C45 family peptidase [Virgibacillus]MYL43061.1 acyl-CoA--6-aminopenicillanic acid acyltransferase [Virgibacillus massiliensis]
MKQIYSDVIQFRGNHYQYGCMQGKALKDSYILENRKKQWKIRQPRFAIHEQEVKAAITPIAPGIWDELCGLRDALDWTMEDVLLEFGGFRLEYKKSGCSIFTGSEYMIRNYDYHPKTYEGRYTVFQPSDQGYATIAPSQRITGRMDGMNEHGLAMGYNFIHRRKPGDGFICNMIGRMILENCKNTDEAVQLLKEIPHRHSFSYVLLDKNGETFIVEASPRSVQVRQSNVCTNHFEQLTKENRYHLDDSYRRQQAIQAQEKETMTAYQAFTMMNDSTRGVFSKKYKHWAGTIHTSAYFPKELKVWFALGGDREPFVFHFKNWLNGDDFNTSRIIGEVDTELPFVHMEENVR